MFEIKVLVSYEGCGGPDMWQTRYQDELMDARALAKLMKADYRVLEIAPIGVWFD